MHMWVISFGRHFEYIYMLICMKIKIFGIRPFENTQIILITKSLVYKHNFVYLQ